jgi:hypothetical protein
MCENNEICSLCDDEIKCVVQNNSEIAVVMADGSDMALF